MSVAKSTLVKAKTPVRKTVKKTSSKVQDTGPMTEPSSQSDTANLLKKRELVENVVRRSGIKKRDAKPVVEALLAELGEALASGRGLALPPFGRAKINRQKELDDGRVLIVKLRQKSAISQTQSSPSASDTT